MDSDFSAKEPSLGYFYQIRYGLYLLLNTKQIEDAKLLIESLDDIEIETNININLFQTKYHVKKDINLTDRSSDFWKTIRVWSEQIKNKQINITETIFSLMTTQNISDDSILLDLKNKNDIDNILNRLKEIAEETTNQTNKKGYEAFKDLDSKEQRTLIENIKIVDASLDFNEIDTLIKNELRFSALPNQIELLLERLEGWFFRNCILHLQNQKDYISFEEIQKQILYITDSFKYDNLPIDFPTKIIPTKEEFQTITTMKFYKQLDYIDLSPRLCENAISNYYRAFNQRSKWLKDDLLNPQEEIDYDRKLVDNWEQKFDLLLDETDELTDEQKKVAGNDFYKKYQIHQIPNISIRDRFQEDYLILGSFQMLADKLKVGWHPEFKNLMEEKEF